LKPLNELGIGAAAGAEALETEIKLDAKNRTIRLADLGKADSDIAPELNYFADGIDSAANQSTRLTGNTRAVRRRTVIHALDKITGANVHLPGSVETQGQWFPWRNAAKLGKRIARDSFRVATSATVHFIGEMRGQCGVAYVGRPGLRRLDYGSQKDAQSGQAMLKTGEQSARLSGHREIPNDSPTALQAAGAGRREVSPSGYRPILQCVRDMQGHRHQAASVGLTQSHAGVPVSFSSFTAISGVGFWVPAQMRETLVGERPSACATRSLVQRLSLIHSLSIA
jgi:hypothetical protein